MNMLIHPKTIKLIKEILKIKISTKRDLEINLVKVCDSLKYLELLLALEKKLKKKISDKNKIKIKDIDKLFK